MAKRIVVPEQKQLLIQQKKQEKRMGPLAMKKSSPSIVSKWKMQSMQFRMAINAGKVHNGGSNFSSNLGPQTFSGLQHSK